MNTNTPRFSTLNAPINDPLLQHSLMILGDLLYYLAVVHHPIAAHDLMGVFYFLLPYFCYTEQQ
ncbi:hypothetical protein [Undibacterium fentianense]|uniref:Uncharacterized protein n=1 Tax=Undibacterium fentianense TaxID=2828728 RepID=A0A941E557_9BURK|nr:hypothetical protein [Undibacterium fentianense]MBR7801771.1 hypothetical protein [Undibacterium fentianense]